MSRAQERGCKLRMADLSFRLSIERRGEPHEVHGAQELLGLFIKDGQLFGPLGLLASKAVQEGGQDPAPELLLGFLAGVGGAEGDNGLLGGGEKLTVSAEDDCFHVRELLK